MKQRCKRNQMWNQPFFVICLFLKKAEADTNTVENI